ncbi:hypothetical protein FRC17_004634 [Serendipita sp. 399]|nr:hypothetical protein FRC17_004634 [Serendipita sp. 399]
MAMNNSHDSINLVRLLKRLEDPEIPAPALVRAENVKYAKSLAKRIYGSDTNPYEQRLSAIEHRLDGSSIASSYRRKAPSIRSYTSAINPITIPVDKAISNGSALSPKIEVLASPTSTIAPPKDDPAALVSQMLLPSEELKAPISSSASLFAGATQPTTKASSISPEFLTASRQTQEEISHKLAEMAAQLRKNAQHFSAALEDDKEALAEADSKLNQNLDVMQKERGRLGVYSAKSSGTTWMVIASILVVCIAWVVMFFVIRLT